MSVRTTEMKCILPEPGKLDTVRDLSGSSCRWSGLSLHEASISFNCSSGCLDLGVLAGNLKTVYINS